MATTIQPQQNMQQKVIQALLTTQQTKKREDKLFIQFCKFKLSNNVQLEIRQHKLFIVYQRCETILDKQTNKDKLNFPDYDDDNYRLISLAFQNNLVNQKQKNQPNNCLNINNKVFGNKKIQLKCVNCLQNYSNMIDMKLINQQQIRYIQQFLSLNKDEFYIKLLQTIAKDCLKIVELQKYKYNNNQIFHQQIQLFVLLCNSCKNLKFLILKNNPFINRIESKSYMNQKQKINKYFNIFDIVIENLAKYLKQPSFNKIVQQFQVLTKTKIKKKQINNNLTPIKDYIIIFNQILKSYKIKPYQFGSGNKQKNIKQNEQQFKTEFELKFKKKQKQQQSTQIQNLQQKSLMQSVSNKKSENFVKASTNGYIIDITQRNQHEYKNICYKINGGKKLVSDRYPSRSFIRNCSLAQNSLNIAIDQGHLKNKGTVKKIREHDNTLRGLRIYTQCSSNSAPKKRTASKQRFGASSIKTTAKKQNLKILNKQRQNHVQKQLYIINRIKQIRYASYNQDQIDKQNKKNEKNIPWNQISSISKEIAKQHIKQNTSQIHMDNLLINLLKNQQYTIQKSNRSENKNTQKDNQMNSTSLQNSVTQFAAPLKPHQTDKETNKNYNNLQLFPTKNQFITKQFNKIQQLWRLIQVQIIQNMDPIGQCINNVKYLCKKYEISTIKQLFLLYKKFFYMRSTFLCCLLNKNQPIITSISIEQWQNLVDHPLHKQKINKIQQENKLILKTLQKMHKKINQNCQNQNQQNKVKQFSGSKRIKNKTKQKCINNQIFQIVIDDEQIYNEFYKETLHSNIANFMDIFNCKKQKYQNNEENKLQQQQELKVLKQYGYAILLTVLSETQENQQNQIKKMLKQYTNPNQNIEILCKYLMQVDLMF